MGATKCKELFLRELRNVKELYCGRYEDLYCELTRQLQGAHKRATSGSQGSYKGLTKKYVKNCYKMQRIVLWELRNVKTGVVGATKFYVSIGGALFLLGWHPPLYGERVWWDPSGLGPQMVSRGK